MDTLLMVMRRFGMGTAAIAIASYGILSALRRIPLFARSETYRAYLPFLLIVMGILLGILILPLFPGEELSIRGLCGGIGSSFSGHIVSFGRRLVKLWVTKKQGAQTAQILFAPTDEEGNTLPPTGEIVIKKEKDGQ